MMTNIYSRQIVRVVVIPVVVSIWRMGYNTGEEHIKSFLFTGKYSSLFKERHVLYTVTTFNDGKFDNITIIDSYII